MRGVGFKVVKADFDRFPSGAVAAEARHSDRAIACRHLRFQAIQAQDGHCYRGRPCGARQGLKGRARISAPPPCSVTLMNLFHRLLVDV